MKKTIAILISFLLICPSLFSQTIKRKEFRSQPAGFEEAWQAVKEGDEYYDMGPAGFRKAREYYLKAYAYNDKNAELNYKIGMCYLFTDQKYEAYKYFVKAWELKPNVSKDIHLAMARGYHMRLEFDNAIKEYTIFKNSFTPKQYKKLNINVDKYIEECLNGKELIKNPVRVIISNLGTNINSEYDDYGSIINMSDSVMYYTSRRPVEGAKPVFIDNFYPEKIYTSIKKGDKWERSRLLEKPFNKPKRIDGVVAFNKDFTKIYTYCGSGVKETKTKKNGDIYVCLYNKEKKKWARKKFKPINTRGQETSMIINATEDTIYFVSDYSHKEWGSRGGKDIYMVTKNSKGKWGIPVNLGENINTPYDEEAIYLHPDGKRLYFSSQGHNSMGGFDIFVSEKNEKGEWGKAVNLGYPINTPDDDVFFVMNRSNRYAYYSSSREGSIGRKDIFKIIYLGAEKEPVAAYDADLIAYFKFDKPFIFRKPIEPLPVDTTIIMKGQILNAKTNEPVKENPAKMNLIDADKSQIVASTASDNEGNYKITIPAKKKYAVEINCQGYLFFLEQIDLTPEKGDIITRDFKITKIEVGQKVVLRNIFFETAKTTLLPTSIDELNKVLKLMTDNPKLRLEISGHTDNQGSLQYNTVLSEGRAKAVVNWLVEHGIDPSRLEYKGYAFTQPIADNKTKEGRAQNRRVEFKVLDVE